MVAVFVLDRGKRCRFINAVAEVLTGYSSAQADGQLFGDLVWRNTPGSFDESLLGRVLEAGSPGEGDVAIIDGQRKRRPLGFRVFPLALDGDGAATLVELVDLSGETGTGRALRESEQRLRLATEATGIGIWDVNVVTGERRWSSEFLSILGLPPGTKPTTSLFSSLIHPDDRERIDAQYARAYESPSDAPYSAEFRILRADTGAERWVSTTGRISFDNDGRAIRGIGTLRDIHERRISEEALRESEERNRLAIESNEIGTWDYDLPTGQLRWSEQFKRLWGLPPDAPADPEILRPLVDAADVDSFRRRWAEALAPEGTGRISLECQIRRADTGERRWCSVAGRIFYDRDRKPVRAIGIMIDTTVRRLAEDRRRLALMEIHHRVKNNLAIVQAILAQTLKSRLKVEDAFDRIQPRLMSMARVHDHLARSEPGEVPLGVLIAGEMETEGLDPQRVTLSGSMVVLDSAAALALGMAMHELVTNAKRFGSLSRPGGDVTIAWEVFREGGRSRLEIDWKERGGPHVGRQAPGLGMRLVESSLLGLGGTAEPRFGAGGVSWHLVLPLPATAAAGR